MAMLISYNTSIGRVLKSLIFVVSVIGVSWSSLIFYQETRSIHFEEIARRVIAGEAFDLETAIDAAALDVPDHFFYCSADQLRAATIIKLKLFENARNRGELLSAKNRLPVLRQSIDQALACVPTDGFLWFARYWAALNAGMDADAFVKDLERSYHFSPREGWVALRRSPFSLAMYSKLPRPLQEKVIDELVELADTGLLFDVVQIIKGAAWPLRQYWLPKMASVRLINRKQIQQSLDRDGYKLTMPGIEENQSRPWNY